MIRTREVAYGKVQVFSVDVDPNGVERETALGELHKGSGGGGGWSSYKYDRTTTYAQGTPFVLVAVGGGPTFDDALAYVTQ